MKIRTVCPLISRAAAPCSSESGGTAAPAKTEVDDNLAPIALPVIGGTQEAVAVDHCSLEAGSGIEAVVAPSGQSGTARMGPTGTSERNSVSATRRAGFTLYGGSCHRCVPGAIHMSALPCGSLDERHPPRLSYERAAHAKHVHDRALRGWQCQRKCDDSDGGFFWHAEATKDQPRRLVTALCAPAVRGASGCDARRHQEVRIRA